MPKPKPALPADVDYDGVIDQALFAPLTRAARYKGVPQPPNVHVHGEVSEVMAWPLHPRRGKKGKETVEETKRYKVVFDKLVVDLASFQLYPYGYTRTELDDVEMENIEIFVGLYTKLKLLN